MASLIDLYDAAQSDTANYMTDFNEATLVISGDLDMGRYSVRDVIEMENREVLEDLILDQDIKELYEAYQSCLKEQEKEVIGMRYGLFGKQPRTQREIASALGISRS